MLGLKDHYFAEGEMLHNNAVIPDVCTHWQEHIHPEISVCRDHAEAPAWLHLASLVHFCRLRGRRLLTLGVSTGRRQRRRRLGGMLVSVRG